MMEELGWKPLHERRRKQRFTLLYNIVNDLVAILADQYITYNNRRSRHGHNKQSKIERAQVFFFYQEILKTQSALDCDTVDCIKQTISRD